MVSYISIASLRGVIGSRMNVLSDDRPMPYNCVTAYSWRDYINFPTTAGRFAPTYN